MGIYNLFIAKEVVSPNAVEQVIPREHSALVFQQKFQDFKFSCGERHKFLADVDGKTVCIHGDVLIMNHRGFGLHILLRPAQNRLDPAQHKGHGKGFCDVVVRHCVEALYLACIIIQGCQHDNGYAAFLAKRFADGKAINPGEQDIEQYQIREVLMEFFQAFHAIAGQQHGISRVHQERFENALNRLLVFDHQNGFGHGTHLRT